MSLKRVLGMMLVSRMAGRGRGRGGFGPAAMLGGLGYRQRGIGGKLGLASLGYMAYQAYQDHQARTTGSGRAAGSSGGMSGMNQDVAGRVNVAASAHDGASARSESAAPDLWQDQAAAETFSDETALLLIRAMVTAAYADGALSQNERMRIMQEIDEAGGDFEDRRTMEREIANPLPLGDLLGHVQSRDLAQQFYLASRTAVDDGTEQNRIYLAHLRQRLDLSEQEAAEVEELAS